MLLWLLQIAAAVEKAGAQTDQKVKMLLQQRAQEVVSKLDLAKALSMDASPEQIVADAMKQAASQLQADGGHALNLAQPNLQPQLPDTLSQVRTITLLCRVTSGQILHKL